MWNLVFNELLIHVVTIKSAYVIAYADDLLFIDADSRQVLEQRAPTCLDLIQTWTFDNGLSVSAYKCACILLKGPLQVASRPVRCLSLKYLGVTIRERLSMGAHVRSMRTKLSKSFAGLTVRAAYL